MAVAMIVVLVTVDLIIIAMVLGGAREHDLTIKRNQTIESFYAAEAGANMAIRELMEALDEDLDGTTGTISDDGVPANDPALGNAQFYVTISQDFPAVGQRSGSRAPLRSEVSGLPDRCDCRPSPGQPRQTSPSRRDRRCRRRVTVTPGASRRRLRAGATGCASSERTSP